MISYGHTLVTYSTSNLYLFPGGNPHTLKGIALVDSLPPKGGGDMGVPPRIRSALIVKECKYSQQLIDQKAPGITGQGHIVVHI